MVRLWLILCLCFVTTTVLAQTTKTVVGEYTYYAPENVTLENAKLTAIERAKTQALADAFGTIVTQSNSTRIENRDGESTTAFASIGNNEVKGEWIETIGDPRYDVLYEQGMLVVKVRVKGKAREIVSANIDLKVKILRNGTDDKFESDVFREGDDLYLSFQSPVSGYIAIYLVDADARAFCLLPYSSQLSGQYPIKANQRYVFFSAKDAPEEVMPYVDEYTMTCSRSPETNQIYVVFSPQPFTKAIDNAYSESLPRVADFKDFKKWLVKNRSRDKRMNLKVNTITITKS